jgi:hypothetical protein
LLHEFSHLPALEILMPVPGTAVPGRVAPPEVDERILARVRALLAKAESTNYPAEAETFTAGAHALMARHSIDHALLAAAGRVPAADPTGRGGQDVDTADEAVAVLLLGVSLAAAAVPEGLPAILSVVLAIGVQRLAAHRAIVKRLSSVETLGSASVVCSDRPAP